ncbi:MAG: DNA polymerase III subunit alpha [Bacteroidaceae bacterium]|nr:DNA polymerase III subunit alpha [Bacteroidaceae bacterium]
MKIKSLETVKSRTAIKVIDCYVDSGYLQGPGGSLPDVDQDFQSDRRQDVKAYIERRYNHDGKQRVFSAGTTTTLKVKAVIKDVARTMRIPAATVNYITAIFDDDKCDFTGIFKLAATNKKIAKFIHDYPQLFEDIRTLMFQPRSNSVHASALLVTPDELDGEDVECFDFVPIKKMDDILVSDNDGYQLDELGLLKNDCLATKELSKLHETIDLCNEKYNAGITFEGLSTGELNDKRVFEILSDGYTQNVFQFSSTGITKFLTQLKPTCIDDLIAANALYRPATMGNLDDYVNCKNGLVEPVYLWGTYNSLKDTYAQVVFQEQIVMMAREIGGFSLGDGVKLVKFVSKKKTDKIKAMKEKFMAGAKKNGCPQEDADAIWEQIEAAGSYCFNKSHATAYAVTAYVGAWLKVHYPTAFYTVALQWADDDELVTLMGEMEAVSNAKVVPPDINVSEDKFHTNYETNEIFWSISRIKQLGAKAVEWIVNERRKNGDFTSIDNFIDRIFKYKLKKYQYWDDPDNEEEATRCPVNARCVLNLILAGCFDKIEHADSVIERYAIVEKAAERLGFEIKEKDIPTEMRNKHYFWSQKQVAISGIGAIDYKRIYNNSIIKPQLKGRVSYATIKDIMDDEMEEKRVGMCATVVEVEEKRFTSKKTNKEETFCKLLLQQNNDVCECVIWPEEYAELRGQLQEAKNKPIVFSAVVKYSDYSGKNQLQFMKRTVLDVL